MTRYLVRMDFTGTRKILISRWLGRNGRNGFDWVADLSEAAKMTEPEAIAATKRYGGRIEVSQ